MKIDTLVLGDYQTNCYIVREDNAHSCAVIDPGYEPEQIRAFLEAKGLTLDAILLTHGHFDHVGAVKALMDTTGCALWIREADYTQKKNPINDYLYPLHDKDLGKISFCEEGEVIHAGSLAFRVMETPGHTRGSVCYLCEGELFSGDTLFAGSCGRTDLPGGSTPDMAESLQRLCALKGDYRVWPGHGGSSYLARERQYNPYMGGLL